MVALLLCFLSQPVPKVDTTSLEQFVAGALVVQEQELTAEVAALEARVKRVRGPAAAAARKQLIAAKATLKSPPFPPKATMMKMNAPEGTVGELTTPAGKGTRAVPVVEIIQVMPKTKLLCRTESGAVFVLQGVSTDGKVDSEWFHLRGIYETAGTTQYESVVGATKTVRVIKPWRHEAAFNALQQNDREKFVPAAAKPKTKQPAAKK